MVGGRYPVSLVESVFGMLGKGLQKLIVKPPIKDHDLGVVDKPVECYCWVCHPGAPVRSCQVQKALWVSRNDDLSPVALVNFGIEDNLKLQAPRGSGYFPYEGERGR